MKSAGGTSLSLFTLTRAMKRRWYLLLIPVILMTPTIALYTLHLPQRFRSQALVAADPGQARLTFGRTDEAALTSTQDQLRLIQETILSQSALEAVNREFSLYPLSAGQLSRKSAEDMKKAIQIQVEGTNAFYVGYEGRSPQEAMAVANRLASMFVEHTSVTRDRRVTQEDNFLDSEVARMREQVAQQDNKLKSYKQSGAQELPERLTANLKQLELLQQEVQSKNDQITAAEATRSADLAELSALEKQGVLDPEPQAKSAPEAAVDDERRKLAELKTKYTPEHPEVKAAEQQLHTLEAAAAAAPAPVIHRQPSPVQMRYFALQAELKALEPRLNNYRQEREAAMAQARTYDRVVDSSPAYETAIAERQKDADVTRAGYETLLAKQQEAKLNHGAEKVDESTAYKIVEPAQLPLEPYSPHPVRVILLGFLGSLGLGIAGIVFGQRMDTTFETAEQFEETMGAPVLSTIPSISAKEPTPGRDARRHNAKLAGLAPPTANVARGITPEQWQHLQKHRVAVLTHPDSIAAQQYKVLALKVQRWMEKTGGKVLAITSSTGAEGKSLTALNLSLALASALESGVLLVDCDLRLPQVHQRLGLTCEGGLGDLLARSNVDPAPFISRVGGLDVIHAGAQSRDRVDLIGTPRTRDLFSSLRRQYRLIVLDCPPIVPIADSLTLADLADGVAMVVRARSTRPELFQRAMDSLEAKSFLGVVLNDVEYSATPYAYAYRYYQQHYVDRN
jgi:polysaccharide biosynthesis transport protein